MPICSRCGRDNPPDGRFCSSCGAPLPAADVRDASDSTSTIALPPEASEVGDESAELADLGLEALLPGTALLVVQRGPSAGSRFLLDADVVPAGRHPDSEIFLDDVTVSRRHAEFVRGADGFRVRDVGSLNGTYVNRDRIDDVALAGGDEVQIGKFRLVFFAGPAAGESA